ncbi:GDSL esterase/lipase At3g48460-like [Tasmannia lanceolata]|uniref:GDSL esterase/lipase At3g48460-like n=1 Tax=Tasmannia lanceolata TaxID=3420 RepID=UPI0040645A1A
MAWCNSQSLYVILFYLFLCLSPSLSLPPPAHIGKFSKIFSFGDSLTDTGNNLGNGLSYQPPYGRLLGRPTGRFSDGRLVVDFLANELSLALLPGYRNTNTDFSYGVNFALAGSTAIDHEFYKKNNLTNPYAPTVVVESLQTQNEWFNDFVNNVECTGKTPAQCKAIMEGSLFWLGEMGANDYATIQGSSVVKPETISTMAVANVIKFVQGLLAKGAKYIIVQGVIAGPQTRTSIIAAHNMLLQERLHEVRKQNPGAMILFADYSGALAEIVMNRAKYGFTEYPTEPCCGSLMQGLLCGMPGTSACADASKYISWDGIHFTEALNEKVSDLFFHHGYIKPPFDTLFADKKAP